MLAAILAAMQEAADTDQDNDQVSDQVVNLLGQFENKTLSAVLLMQKLGLAHRPSFRNNYLAPALSLGLIEMTVPEKPNSKLQKYRITEKGLITIKRNKSEKADGS